MRYFPSGIAQGPAFCNRVEERKRLITYIDNIQHTVVMAARRYGKSSLITQVMREKRYHYAWIDFLSATTKEETEEKIRMACKELLLLLAPELKKIQIQTVAKVKSMSPELNLNAMGQSLTLNLASHDTIPIDKLLMQIDQYAEKTNKKAVFVFDEFQQITEIKENQIVEASIRHAVERSQSTSYVFSGSNRHLLQEMFSQSNRPLYRLCRVMQLDRIEDNEYKKFIQHAAKSRWGTTIRFELIDKIITLAECHPFYMNALCNELWLNKNPPKNIEFIESVWKSYVIAHKSVIVSDIISLPLNQKKIIKALSHAYELNPYSNKFSLKLKISTASIRRAIEALMLKDIVYQDESSHYKVVDPAVAYYFRYLH